MSRYLLWRTASAVGVLLCAASLVFLVLYAGPLDPAETIDAPISNAELGLSGSLWAQYLHFMRDVLTFDFESWVVTTPAGTPANPTTDGNALILDRLPQTLWLSFWAVAFALVVGLPVGLLAGLRPGSSIDTGAVFGGTVARAAPAFLVAVIAIVGLRHSERVLFGFDWFGFAVETTRMAGTIPLGDLGTTDGFLFAVKRALPASVALGSALLGITARVGRTAMREARRANHLSGVRARGGGGTVLLAKHLLRNASVALLSTLQAQTAVLLGGVVVVEYAFDINGVGMLFEDKMHATDVALIGALLFLGAFLLVVVGLVQDVLLAVATRRVPNAERISRSQSVSAGADGSGGFHDDFFDARDDDRLRPLRGTGGADGLVGRVRENPVPALVWMAGCGVLLVVELGALADFAAGISGFDTGLSNLPTLLDRETIPNEGYRTPGGGWAETFLGLPAATAWAVRVLAVYLYAGCWLAWLWVGYRLVRSQYRATDRTPLDAALARFRGHRWGQFGFAVAFAFVVAAVFAPALAPTTYYAHPYDGEPGSTDQFEYYDAETGSVETVSVGIANMYSKSEGDSRTNVGPMSYDDYGRFHPLGTDWNGYDLFAAMLAGARLSLLVLAATTAAALALGVGLGLLAAIGPFDRAVRFAIDVVTALPRFPLLVALSFAFAPSSLAEAYDGAPLLGAFVGALSWPAITAVVRRTASRTRGGGRTQDGYRTRNAGWVDAAESLEVGRVGLLVRRVRACVKGDVLAALGVVLTGAFVAEMALAYLYLGTIAPSPSLKQATPEWGAILLMSQEYFATASWHVPLIPGVAVALVATGFTALADGIRDCAGSGRVVEGTATGATTTEETNAAGDGG